MLPQINFSPSTRAAGSFISLLALGVLVPLLSPAQSPPTVQQVIDRIVKETGVAPPSQTVDTVKAGDANTPVKGIAVTMMATLDVLQRAVARGDNFVITHEPTFYNHEDSTKELEDWKDPVLAEKEKYIADHHLVIWRFHDLWHERHPDGILEGMTQALQWKTFQNPQNPNLFKLPALPLSKLALQLKQTLGINVVRVVGFPGLNVTNVAMLPGAAGSDKQIQMLEQPDVQVLVIGETREWETVEYVADAVTEKRQKALIILGHIPSEQMGMKECARWMQTFISGVPIDFVPAREPFWPARAETH